MFRVCSFVRCSSLTSDTHEADPSPSLSNAQSGEGWAAMGESSLWRVHAGQGCWGVRAAVMQMSRLEPGL